MAVDWFRAREMTRLVKWLNWSRAIETAVNLSRASELAMY